MDFFELLDRLLAELNIPFYEGAPEFERSPPETFITYNIYDVPNLRGCGNEMTANYHLTLNIYTTGNNKKSRAVNLCTALTALLVRHGFIRQGGSFGLMNDFPRYYHRIIEFNYDYDKGDD